MSHPWRLNLQAPNYRTTGSEERCEQWRQQRDIMPDARKRDKAAARHERKIGAAPKR